MCRTTFGERSYAGSVAGASAFETYVVEDAFGVYFKSYTARACAVIDVFAFHRVKNLKSARPGRPVGRIYLE